MTVCEHLKIGGHDFLVCGRRHVERNYCACGRAADFECDWKVPAKASGTCDTPICAAHAKMVGPGKHLCPLHQHQWDEWQKKHPPAQGSLFQEVA